MKTALLILAVALSVGTPYLLLAGEHIADHISDRIEARKGQHQ